MSNGDDAPRTDRKEEFNPDQRIYLLERDLDQMARDWRNDVAGLRADLVKVGGQLRTISAGCISILTMLVVALALIVIQGGR